MCFTWWKHVLEMEWQVNRIQNWQDSVGHFSDFLLEKCLNCRWIWTQHWIVYQTEQLGISVVLILTVLCCTDKKYNCCCLELLNQPFCLYCWGRRKCEVVNMLCCNYAFCAWCAWYELTKCWPSLSVCSHYLT